MGTDYGGTPDIELGEEIYMFNNEEQFELNESKAIAEDVLLTDIIYYELELKEEHE